MKIFKIFYAVIFNFTHKILFKYYIEENYRLVVVVKKRCI